ncbi:MAG TPA: hypothetical protein VLH15_02785 [Dehalococcoidales bacterium]|nr:hypothetical protein [Dehalococcoidales bacterium]
MADYEKYILRNAAGVPVLKSRSHTPSVGGRQEMWPGITGMGCNFGINSITEPYLLPDPPHKHEFDEYLFFIGGNPLNMGEFDAEIDVALGDKWEVYSINTTSIIYIPKGLQHCPIHVKRVGKPFLFGHILLSGQYISDKGGELYSRSEKKASEVTSTEK